MLSFLRRVRQHGLAVGPAQALEALFNNPVWMKNSFHSKIPRGGEARKKPREASDLPGLFDPDNMVLFQ
jgi:hypothetical protein